jgi:hypothetical protein
MIPSAGWILIPPPLAAEDNAEWISPLSNLLVSHIHEILGENKR